MSNVETMTSKELFNLAERKKKEEINSIEKILNKKYGVKLIDSLVKDFYKPVPIKLNIPIDTKISFIASYGDTSIDDSNVYDCLNMAFDTNKQIKIELDKKKEIVRKINQIIREISAEYNMDLLSVVNFFKLNHFVYLND